MTAKGGAPIGRSLLAILLALGGYTLLTFLGAPNHSALLLSQAQQAAVAQSCDTGSLLCRGIHSLLPFLSHTVILAKPFLWYMIACLVVVGTVIVGRWALKRAEVVRFKTHPARASTFGGDDKISAGNYIERNSKLAPIVCTC